MNKRDLQEALGGLYLGRENGWFFGVCAGIADRFDIDLNVLRLLVGIAGVIMTMPTIIAYALAAFVLNDRPLTPKHPDRERDFWRTERNERSY